MEKMGGTIPSQSKNGSVEPVFDSSPKGGAKIYVCDIPVNFQSDEPISSSSKAPSDEWSLGAKKQTREVSRVCFLCRLPDRRVDLGARGAGNGRAFALNGEGGGDRGTPHGVDLIEPFGERDGQNTVEAIAGAGRIDSLDRDRRHVHVFAFAHEHCSGCAQRDHRAADAELEQFFSRAVSIVDRMDRDPGVEFGFGLVGGEVIGAGKEPGRQGMRR